MIVSAHQDFWVVNQFRNIKTRIKTGYKYEEIKKVQIIGELAQLLAEKLNYNQPILLDFNHFYVGVSEPIYFLSFDKGIIKYNYDPIRIGKPLLTKKAIVVRQVSNKFDIVNTLKMLEYAILNWKTIKKEQIRIKYDENYCDWIINAIDQRTVTNIETSKESDVITGIKHFKIYRPEKDFKKGMSYFWQNDKYHIIFKEKNKERIITTLTSIYDIQKVRSTIFIFESPSEFVVFDEYKEEIVSKKWTIENADKNYRLYNINQIGGDKYSISFYYYSKEPGLQPKNQILIYSLYDDKLVQDLNRLMNE